VIAIEDFYRLKGSIACGVQMLAAFNCLRRSMPSAFNCLRRSTELEHWTFEPL